MNADLWESAIFTYLIEHLFFYFRQTEARGWHTQLISQLVFKVFTNLKIRICFKTDEMLQDKAFFISLAWAEILLNL